MTRTSGEMMSQGELKSERGGLAQCAGGCRCAVSGPSSQDGRRAAGSNRLVCQASFRSCRLGERADFLIVHNSPLRNVLIDL